jgi:SAM-dependent methyltransferase
MLSTVDLKSQPQNWIQYWDQDVFWAESELWKVNAKIFLNRAAKILKFTSEDCVLNIGAGPGYLEPLLSSKVKSICALDTSENFVRMCERNNEHLPQVTCRFQGPNYTDLSDVPDSFSLFLCVSAVQYYKNPSEILDLIQSASRKALPGARMLIADLPLKRNLFEKCWDVLCSFAVALKEGYLFILIKTALQVIKHSQYRRFSKQSPSLEFSKHDLQRITESISFKTTLIPKSLSVYANRPSLLIEFP